jgi:multidrug efflux pump subunit AcrA (membrane-fusion protein)
MTEQAEARYESARANLSRWRSDQVSRMLETATTGAAAPSPEISARESRAEAADALDALEAAQAAKAATQAALGDAEADLQRAQHRVEAAGLPVIAGEVDRLLAEAAAIRETLEAKLAAIDFVTNIMPFGSSERVRIDLTRAPLPPGVEPPDRSRHPAVVVWREAQTALQKNADAPLPT